MPWCGSEGSERKEGSRSSGFIVKHGWVLYLENNTVLQLNCATSFWDKHQTHLPSDLNQSRSSFACLGHYFPVGWVHLLIQFPLTFDLTSHSRWLPVFFLPPFKIRESIISQAISVHFHIEVLSYLLLAQICWPISWLPQVWVSQPSLFASSRRVAYLAFPFSSLFFLFASSGQKCLRHSNRVLDTQVLISPAQEQVYSEVRGRFLVYFPSS